MYSGIVQHKENTKLVLGNHQVHGLNKILDLGIIEHMDVCMIKDVAMVLHHHRLPCRPCQHTLLLPASNQFVKPTKCMMNTVFEGWH